MFLTFCCGWNSSTVFLFLCRPLLFDQNNAIFRWLVGNHQWMRIKHNQSAWVILTLNYATSWVLKISKSKTASITGCTQDLYNDSLVASGWGEEMLDSQMHFLVFEQGCQNHLQKAPCLQEFPFQAVNGIPVIPNGRLRGWKSIVPSGIFIKSLVEEKIMFLGESWRKTLHIIQPQHGVMHVGHATSINFLPHKEKVKVLSDFSNQISASSKLQTLPVSSTYRVRSTLSFGSFTTTALSLAAWMVWQDAWHVLGQMPILPMNSS